MSSSKAYRFRICVESIDETAPGAAASLTFDAQSHDDILDIAKNVRAGTTFTSDEANALAVGLKLFTGVMLANRQDPLFDEIQPAMRAFIGNLKSRVASATPKEDSL